MLKIQNNGFIAIKSIPNGIFALNTIAMLVFPKAKINLGLNIIERRSDGFHDIETLFYPVSLFDALEVVQGAGGQNSDILTITGTHVPGETDQNIVLKAAEKIRHEFGIPHLKIHLHKNIPVGAGLGGGSSDGAFMLKTLNRLFGLGLSCDDLKPIAAGLGSDSPFFIDCLPAFASGRGEILKPSAEILDGFHGVLINPGIEVKTKDAYAGCIPSVPAERLEALLLRPVEEWKDTIVNDFERTIFPVYPEIRDIKETLYDCGALYSSMSGSGSTVYGIFRNKPVLPDYVMKDVIFNGLF